MAATNQIAGYMNVAGQDVQGAAKAHRQAMEDVQWAAMVIAGCVAGLTVVCLIRWGLADGKSFIDARPVQKR